MMELFDQTTLECSKLITQLYSTSFTLGIKTLGKKFHYPIYAIYGFVRYADEIVDTFHSHDKAELLARFKKDTYQAIEEGISLNPVLHSFQMVVNKYKLDHALIEAFLHSMEMDLDETTYDKAGYEEYIYGSAEVVGLMCLQVFCEGDTAMYEDLLPPAKSLGSAFQKVNFIRDIKSDFEDRGRVYFPGVDFESFSQQSKEIIEADIQKDFDDALIGIKKLPKGAQTGVLLAYKYYLKLFKKIKNCPSAKIKEQRIRIPNSRKMSILLETYFQQALKTG
ncbi:phytoene/squalene synthase family protein [Roseivirga sp. E12]|uniref:phytoene/squalene synthase family protein n=1 Tax=Roseivirga sp. E12 TaxID=2819237 RepID=UPI001ABC6E77|nr:phytoene/squalene synthase family protein [Roseivirga sp. E12]MBO3699979.1 phytoene/squalene synthase family protein [Roseivirga sp. E12]